MYQSFFYLFADEKNDKLARQLAWLGINKDTYARSNKGTYAWKYDVDYLGYKYNGNAIMAAIGLVQLRYRRNPHRYSFLYQDVAFYF